MFVRVALCIVCVSGLLCSVSVRIVLFFFVPMFVFVAVVFVSSYFLCVFVVCIVVCVVCVPVCLFLLGLFVCLNPPPTPFSKSFNRD